MQYSLCRMNLMHVKNKCKTFNFLFWLKPRRNKWAFLEILLLGKTSQWLVRLAMDNTVNGGKQIASLSLPEGAAFLVNKLKSSTWKRNMYKKQIAGDMLKISFQSYMNFSQRSTLRSPSTETPFIDHLMEGLGVPLALQVRTPFSPGARTRFLGAPVIQ